MLSETTRFVRIAVFRLKYEYNLKKIVTTKLMLTMMNHPHVVRPSAIRYEFLQFVLFRFHCWQYSVLFVASHAY